MILNPNHGLYFQLLNRNHWLPKHIGVIILASLKKESLLQNIPWRFLNKLLKFVHNLKVIKKEENLLSELSDQNKELLVCLNFAI